MREEAIEKGWIKDNNEEVDHGYFPTMNTPFLTAEEIWKLKNQAVKEVYFRPRFILKQIRNIKNFNQFKENIDEFLLLVKNTFMIKK